MRIENEGTLKVLVAEEGYKIYSPSANQYYDRLYLGMNDAMENYREIQVELSEEKSTIVTLEDVKKAKIQMSKDNLENYLAENPLFSRVKYEDGRYYSVTSSKQQQLTSKLLMYQGYIQAGLEYELTWNNTGNMCESWEYNQLFILASQIDLYVTPLVKMQQSIEVNIQNAISTEEVENIDVSYSKENIEKHINI